MTAKLKQIDFKIEAFDILVHEGKILVHERKYKPKLIFAKIADIAQGYGLNDNYLITIKTF